MVSKLYQLPAKKDSVVCPRTEAKQGTKIAHSALFLMPGDNIH
jgi:hypothetical protein